MVDVLVAGAGPAGCALAGHCARLGLDVTVVAPHPHRPWRATYGLWRDVPAGGAVATPAAGTWAFATSEHRLERDYAVLDPTKTRLALTAPGVTVIDGQVAAAVHGPRGSTVTLRDGRRIAAAVT